MPNADWIKLDLHIHTLDDPKDVIDYSAHQLLERARSALVSGGIAFADAKAVTILFIPAAES